MLLRLFAILIYCPYELSLRTVFKVLQILRLFFQEIRTNAIAISESTPAAIGRAAFVVSPVLTSVVFAGFGCFVPEVEFVLETVGVVVDFAFWVGFEGFFGVGVSSVSDVGAGSGVGVTGSSAGGVSGGAAGCSVLAAAV